MAKQFKRRKREELEYTPIGWEGVEKPLTFKFKPLSQKQIARFIDNGTRLDVISNKIILGTSELDYDVAREAITGWENLIVDGEEVKFEAGVDGKFKEELLEDLDIFDIMVEVGQYISMVSKNPDNI